MVSVIQKIVQVFSEFEGAPDDLVGECARWVATFAGHEERLRALMLQRRPERRWVPLEQVARTLGVDVAADAQGEGVGRIGPISRQWSEASVRFPCGPREARVRAQQSAQVSGRRGPTEEEAREWTRALTTARVADGNHPHRLVGPARYEVESAWNEAYCIARSKGRYCLSDEQERAFTAYLRDADLKDAAAGWEVPPSPTAQAQAEEEADAGLPPAARRFVGR